MKKLFFFAAMLISIAATAQSQTCVTAKQVSANYNAKQVTFDLTWTACNGTNHLYRVWIFVDYRDATGTTKGTWQRALINGTAAGTFINGSAGTQRVTLTLANTLPAKFDWCAFATDYPPNATMSNNTYTLKGTPPFVINGTYTTSARTYTGNYITKITDATRNPEGIIRVPGCDGATFTLTSAGFANPTTYNVGGMIWSAPVTAAVCSNKTTMQSNTSASDCRSNPGYDGDYFTWCMVMTHAPILCPSPWRVPTEQDFVNLDVALGGTGVYRTNATNISKFFATSGTAGQFWGGQKNGFTQCGGTIAQSGQGVIGVWYSATIGATGYPCNLHVGDIGTEHRVYPCAGNYMCFGFGLRCVR